MEFCSLIAYGHTSRPPFHVVKSVTVRVPRFHSAPRLAPDGSDARPTPHRAPFRERTQPVGPPSVGCTVLVFARLKKTGLVCAAAPGAGRISAFPAPSPCGLMS